MDDSVALVGNHLQKQCRDLSDTFPDVSRHTSLDGYRRHLLPVVGRARDPGPFPKLGVALGADSWTYHRNKHFYRPKKIFSVSVRIRVKRYIAGRTLAGIYLIL